MTRLARLAAAVAAGALLVACSPSAPEEEPTPSVAAETPSATPTPSPTTEADLPHPPVPDENGSMPSTEGGLVSFPSQQELEIGDTAVAFYVGTAEGIEKPVAYLTLTGVTARGGLEPRLDGLPVHALTFTLTVEALEDYPLYRSDHVVDLPDGNSGSGFFDPQQPAPDEMPRSLDLTAGETATVTITIDAPGTEGVFRHREPNGLPIASWSFAAAP
ncbi:hypothetical protein ICW40_07030 [Actinotalea ferrariae]|uniref:hypothetical protein n=1 Tax=Actinotalea ferrariae TaxID=1386098 RepID=UPI001C8C7EDE|nr:hypothetical protein [Actinotalea ferrariae]MBX9244560.1 hypothetical protein [Actinotalea ferrariae]